MSVQVKAVVLLLLLLNLSACAAKGVLTPTSGESITGEVTSTDSTLTQEISPLATDETIEPTPTAILVSFSDDLRVRIDTPADGAVVNIPELEVKGLAAIGTTLTINNDILYIENDEPFSDKLSLVEGENPIEIIGSDADGNEVSLYLTVYYEP